MADPDALYPIREISRLTGVTPITLRAWERRYDLIEPVRTDSGHRLYTQEHVDFINQAVELTKRGIPISKVKAVISERQEAEKNLRSHGDIDFSLELIQACRECDYLETHQLVDQLYVDLLEEQVKKVIVDVTLMVNKEEPAVQVLWQSVIVPLLSARIRQGRRLLDKIGRQNVYITSLEGEQGVLQRIMANTALEKGFNPMLGLAVETEDLVDTLKKLHCEALILIAPDADEITFEKWKQWSANHSSVETFFVTNNDTFESNRLNFKVISLQHIQLM